LGSVNWVNGTRSAVPRDGAGAGLVAAGFGAGGCGAAGLVDCARPAAVAAAAIAIAAAVFRNAFMRLLCDRGGFPIGSYSLSS
jgi:hypothetical protein